MFVFCNFKIAFDEPLTYRLNAYKYRIIAHPSPSVKSIKNQQKLQQNHNTNNNSNNNNNNNNNNNINTNTDCDGSGLSSIDANLIDETSVAPEFEVGL